VAARPQGGRHDQREGCAVRLASDRRIKGRNLKAFAFTVTRRKVITGDIGMNFVSQSYLRADELTRKWSKGQTMTEYTLIMGAIAIVVFAVFQTTGHDIETLVNAVNARLTGPAS
jgi:Flp pilus assembly pilin Flp